MGQAELKGRRRSDYKFFLDYRTRWSDNDMYDHMNNSIYYFLFDSVVGLVVHSHCDYFSPVGFPALVQLGLRVNKLGKSSVTYEIGVFEEGQEDVKAVGEFVHVFVESKSRKPAAMGMAEELKRGLIEITIEVKAKL